MNIRKMLNAAAELSRVKRDKRRFYLGAVAIRSDNASVTAYNGCDKEINYKLHCEARLARKLDKGSIVFLARTTADKQWANSKPCHSCERIFKSISVKYVYYTSGPNEWQMLKFTV